MQLVNEKDNLSITIFYFLKNGFQTLFYLSTALHLVHRRDWREDAVQAYSRGALRREPFVKTARPSDWDY